MAMLITNREFEDIIRKGGHFPAFKRAIESFEVLGKTPKEAKILAYDSWYGNVLAMKHKVDLGGGKIKTTVDLDAITAKGDPTRDADWVYNHVEFDDVCEYGKDPSYPKQPIAPSATAYALWRGCKYNENGLKDFIAGFYKTYGPQKSEIKMSQQNKDDNRGLIDLNKSIANAKRKSEADAIERATKS